MFYKLNKTIHKCRFPIDENTRILEEIDGVRLFDMNNQEFLSPVSGFISLQWDFPSLQLDWISESCSQTFQVAALAPSATLLEAYKEYEVGTLENT